MHLLGLVGIAIAVLGFGLSAAPGFTFGVLRLLGVRRQPRSTDRIASWLLVILGLAITLLSRVL